VPTLITFTKPLPAHGTKPKRYDPNEPPFTPPDFMGNADDDEDDEDDL
jgi:hypothetical protein